MAPLIVDPRPVAALVLADGTIFRGRSIGAPGTTLGEVVFNTAMTGYQEILTDPSYAGQIVTLTYPHIGNTGVNDEDVEAPRVFAAGLVIRDLPQRPSNFRMQRDLSTYLRDEGIVGIADIDTRKLTRILREKGAQAGVIVAAGEGQPLTDAMVQDALAQAQRYPGMAGQDLAKVVSTRQPYPWTEGTWKLARADGTPGYVTPDAFRFHVVAFDYGVKRNILRLMADRGCRITVVPAQTPVDEVLKLAPDGIFLSNGPGDPEPCTYAIEAAREFIARRLPTFGICLGHQIMGLAVGGRTLKMKFGHHGANHPGGRRRVAQGLHHQPEPRLRGRREVAARERARDPRVAVRRLAAGLRADRRAGVLLPGPPRGEPRPARHRRPVRPLREADGGGAPESSARSRGRRARG